MHYKNSSVVIPSLDELEKKISYRLANTSTGIEIVLKNDIFFKVFGYWYILPKEFKSDGASIPRFVPLKPYDKRWLFGAMVHDYLYRTQFVPRKIADAIFKKLLQETAGKFYAYMFYLSVRVFGIFAWISNKRKGLLRFEGAMQRWQKFICKLKY